VDEGDVPLGGGVVVCWELGVVFGVVPVGFCGLPCCGCWLASSDSWEGVLSWPPQECHAGKAARVIIDSRTDLRMTLML
jgi:hypothetical protein